MGGGNGQKSKMAREKNLEKQKAAGKGSQLESNKKAMSIQTFGHYFVLSRETEVFKVIRVCLRKVESLNA
ncbi:hypothetical protein GOBAR_DD30976 [Gossypium barbadense]|nr:hypothetical protein GOBAR_DD30976 [Gossypium barbadense]